MNLLDLPLLGKKFTQFQPYRREVSSLYLILIILGLAGLLGIKLSGISLYMSLIISISFLGMTISYGILNLFGSIITSYLTLSFLSWSLIPGHFLPIKVEGLSFFGERLDP